MNDRVRAEATTGLDDARWRSLLDHPASGLDVARWRSLLDHPASGLDDARWRSLLDHPASGLDDARWRSLLDHPDARCATTPSSLSTGPAEPRFAASCRGQSSSMSWAYILECADGTFYVGSTINLDNRLHMHNLGIGSAYTRPAKRRPVSIAWSAEFESVTAAFAFEKQVQNWGRAKRIALIEGRLEDLPGLARGRNRPPKTEDG